MPNAAHALPRPGLLRTSTWAAALTLAVAGLGGWATELGPWYAALKQPPWKPPDSWFGPAWTLIYTLTAAAGVMAWRATAQDAAARRRVAWTFGLNAALNIGWSVVFFRLKRPDAALAEVLLLWLSIVLMIVVVSSIGRTLVPALLLLPYLAWVAFAGWLNLAVVQLNGPF